MLTSLNRLKSARNHSLLRGMIAAFLALVCFAIPLFTISPSAAPEYQEGDIVTFGRYEQDNITSNGAEDIEWIVLKVCSDRLLLLSRYALDSERYHYCEEDVDWETCSLRKWLNGSFFNDAFSFSEQRCILSDFSDAVFVLSQKEAEYYLPQPQDRICYPTAYCAGQNVYVNPTTGGSWWLLRTSGEDGSKFVMSVNSDGTMDYDGGHVESDRGVVRPAIWVRNSVFADSWYCPSCGRYNVSNFCSKDGTSKFYDLEPNAKGSRSQQAIRGHGILQPDYNVRSDSGKAGPTYNVFGSTISKDRIASIKFLNSLVGVPKDAWDVSEAGDSSVLAWVTPVGDYGMYDLFIAGDGGVWAPEDCTYLFAGYRQMNSLDFNNAFWVSGCRTMRGMFVRDELITELDFSGWDTSSVTDMSEMFYFCSNLEKFDLRHLDTSSVTNMSYMFSRFGGTDTLDLSSLDTSSVTDMSNMFFQSWDLRNLNLSSFNTSSVKTSWGFLCGGLKLEKLTVGPKFNRTILVNSLKTNLFMAENGTINGQPWRTFLYG